MQTFKAVFFKPDPAEQKRKCDQLIRKNVRMLDRDIQSMKVSENKARQSIPASLETRRKEAC